MIKFKTLSWNNVFSYGTNNSINFDSSPLTQLVGKNGHGKSSIALILEEVLFNTNSKKIKKSDVLNRYTKDKSYSITLTFEKDGVPYEIKTNRTSTSSTVKLLCNGLDISNHTATGTYKAIEQILGFDHKTFSQIVYQSSIGSLEFLTATDTARKKFLIELLNLSSYTKALECFKDIASDMTKKVEATQTKANTISAWMEKYKGVDLSPKPLLDEPVEPIELKEKVAIFKNELKNIEATNKKITQNNTYKAILDGIVLDNPPNKSTIDVVSLQVELANKKKELKEGSTLASKCKGPTTQCPTCSQEIDNSRMFNLAIEFNSNKPVIESRITELEKQILVAQQEENAFTTYQTKVSEWEKYHALYDPKLQQTPLDREILVTDINMLTNTINNVESEISKVRASNTKVAEHNSKVAVISGQMKDMADELATAQRDLIQFTEELTNIQILVKAFSTTGLVAYKIECLVKDLEELTNEYLSILADGRFQLGFKIAASDKLNVVITDNGRDIDITALSSGERARVNVATLLAIRKLMQTLSNSRTNLLILDETIENLDAEGKEKLIEVLLEEKNLNTFLISHGFTHPLLEKLSVVKEHNISRIE